MTRHLLMSEKERLRYVLLKQVELGSMKLMQVAKQLGVSYRQIQRSWKRYQNDGEVGLIHVARGSPSNRRYGAGFREEVLAFYESKLEGFGPTLACEKLAENNYQVDHETLRRWLLSANLWKKSRKRGIHRKRRERRLQFGELVQLDGSFHDWFSNGEEECLMNLVDDATTTTYSLLFEEETTEGAMKVLQGWIERYGVPQALYTDRKNVYITEREPTLEEQLSGEEPLTVFGKACKRLGIRIIAAYSPEAKGRVERNHAVYQDRFVKELKYLGISTYEGANELLHNGFVDGLNQRFAVKAVSKEDGHRPLLETENLHEILCWESVRQLQKDATFSYQNCCYQIMRPLPEPLKAKARVTIRIHLDRTMSVHYQEIKLTYQKIAKAEKTCVRAKAKAATKLKARGIAKSRIYDTPWRHYNEHWLSGSKLGCKR